MHLPGVGLVPEPFLATNKQPSNHPGALSRALDQTETIKLFAAKKKKKNSSKVGQKYIIIWEIRLLSVFRITYIYIDTDTYTYIYILKANK